jgi:hypothetical protein
VEATVIARAGAAALIEVTAEAIGADACCWKQLTLRERGPKGRHSITQVFEALSATGK